MLIFFFVYFLNAAYVKEYTWEDGYSFLDFLQNHNISKSVYFNLDENDQEIVTEIIGGIKYHILYSDDGSIEQVLIPINDELQIHLINYNENYKFSTETISYKEKIKSVFIDINSSPHKDIVDKTNNYSLANEFLIACKQYINFKKEIKKGDRLVILYKEKTRLGKTFGDIAIESAMIKRKGETKYIVRYKNKYYDETGKLPDIIISSSSSYSFATPCKYRKITSTFTLKRWHPILRRYRPHYGIDYAGPVGTPIKASANGKVVFVGWKGGYGRTIEIQHSEGYKTLYAHLSQFNAGINGKNVKQGQVIGYMGSSGRSTGSHLHFGLYSGNKPIDPAKKIVIQNKQIIKKTPTLLEDSNFRKLLALGKSKIEEVLEKSPQNDNFNFALVKNGDILNYTFKIDDKSRQDNSTQNQNYAMAKVVYNNLSLESIENQAINVAENVMEDNDSIIEAYEDEGMLITLNDINSTNENIKDEVFETNETQDILEDDDNTTLVENSINQKIILKNEINTLLFKMQNEKELLSYINERDNSFIKEIKLIKQKKSQQNVLIYAEKLGKSLINI